MTEGFYAGSAKPAGSDGGGMLKQRVQEDLNDECRFLFLNGEDS